MSGARRYHYDMAMILVEAMKRQTTPINNGDELWTFMCNTMATHCGRSDRRTTQEQEGHWRDAGKDGKEYKHNSDSACALREPQENEDGAVKKTTPVRRPANQRRYGRRARPYD